MFCKWCGNNLQPTDITCPSCGRETPPMSDCGGFYDLKHCNRTAPIPAPEPVPPKSIVVPQCPVVEKMEPKYARDRKAAKSHHTVTLSCFAIVLVAIVFCGVLALRISANLDKVTALISNISPNLTINSEENDMKETAENPELTNSAVDIPYSITLGVTVKNAENVEIGTVFDFGDYAKTAKAITTITEDGAGETIDVSYVLNEKEESIKLGITYGVDESAVVTIAVRCDTDMELFKDQTFTYSWQYFDKNQNWVDIRKELLDESKEYCSLYCNEEFWSTVSETEGTAELRCIISAVNEGGDTMTITMDGFAVPRNLRLG